MKTVKSLTFFFCALTLSARAALVPLSPVGGAVVEMLPESQKAVFAGATQGERAAIAARLQDGKWREAAPLVLEWLATDGESWPWKIRIAKDETLTDGIDVWVSEQDAETVACDGGMKFRHVVARANLESGQTYWWKVWGNVKCSEWSCGSTMREGGCECGKSPKASESPVASFATAADVPRWIALEGRTKNVRDLGGWRTADGRRVRQGMAFRGQALNDNSPNGETIGRNRLTVEDVKYLTKTLGIKTDLDLRWPMELAGMTTSPLGDGVRFVNNDRTANYADIFKPQGKKAMAANFRVFCDKSNYPIYFHCIHGADRTGSLAYVLNGILGVSKDDLERDWESTFYPEVRDGKPDDPLSWCSTLRLDEGFAKYAKEGDSLKDRIEAYLADCGVTPDEISSFRKIMLEGKEPAPIVRVRISQDAALEANGVVVNGKNRLETERRDFADGWAVRYILPEGGGFVDCEETIWTLPLDAKVWYQENGMDYERPYAATFVRDVPVGAVVNFPVTAKLADGTYRLITEANVVDWTDSAAEYLGDGRFAVRYVNDPKGFRQSGSSTTPWRVMLVAEDLPTLATSDIVRRLCPAPSPEVAAKCAEFVKSGRCVWQWLPTGAPVYAEQKEWYDKTKELGFEYYLIDDGWREWRDGDMDQWACLKRWIDYGKSIGVETFIWVDSMEMPDAVKRRAYLGKVKASGAVGIKIDFFPPPSYAQMARYEEILADTLELGLMTDLHGTVKPTGRERTWPHEVAREAIRGHEWHISRYGRIQSQSHDCILPFNRLVQGHADYTPMVFEPGELVHFTWARELAQGVVFSAPFLCFGDKPGTYLESPMSEFVKKIPAVYDETKCLPGSEIGECALFAKRSEGVWFLAAMNGSTARSVKVDLGFLGDGRWEMLAFADGRKRDKWGNWRLDDCTRIARIVSTTDSIDIAMRSGGGFAARFVKENP